MSSPMGVDGLLETTTKDCKKTDHTTKAEEEHTDLLTRSTHVNMPSSELTVQSLFGVKGLVAVVTGGGSGIGLMITKALAVNGASKVYIVGRRRDVLDAAAQAIDPNVVMPLPGDVTCQETLLQLADTVQAATGYVNLVVANAGIMGPRPLKDTPDGLPPSVSEYRTHALQTPTEDFTKTYAVNNTSVYYTALAFLDLLDEGNKRGNMGPDWHSQILATSSIGGFSRLRGASFAYNSSKAAVTHLMKMLATSFVPFKIRCNVLAPGPFPSDMTTGIFGSKASFETIIPAGRAGKEEDIGGAILYLASKAGAYLNGTVLVVDGGRLGTLVSTY